MIDDIQDPRPDPAAGAAAGVTPQPVTPQPLTECRETLDAFVDAMLSTAREAKEHPKLVKGAPYSTPVARLDETRAARKPVLRWEAHKD